MFESKYYSTKNASEGDIITIKSDPKEEETQWGPKVKCQIDLDGDEKTWTICPTAGRNLAITFGDPEKTSWVGKKVEIKLDKTKQGVAFLNATAVEDLNDHLTKDTPDDFKFGKGKK